MSGETNRLIALAKEIIVQLPAARELDVIASTGEQVTIGLLAMAMHEEGLQGQELYRAAGSRADRQHVSPRRASCRSTTSVFARISLKAMSLSSRFSGC
jgi:aspartokinase